MRAIVFDQHGSADVLRLAEVEKPAPGPNQVRIRIRAAAVNPADFKWRHGAYASGVQLKMPHILGYDVAGTVDAVGDEVADLKTGTRVVAVLTAMGGYAEYAVADLEAVAPLPDNVEFATACALPSGGLTGLQLIEDHIQPRPGETVLVTGATGSVGRFAVHAALALGVRTIAAVRRKYVEFAERLGAGDVVVMGEKLRPGVTFDHVADTAGGADVTALCKFVPPNGRIRTVATTPIDPDGLASTPQFVIARPDFSLIGRAVQIVASGALEIPIAKRLPLQDAAEAHRLIEAGGFYGKLVLEP